MTQNQHSARGRPWGAPLLALGVAASLAGCGNLLEVENPNNVSDADAHAAVAATALVNGAQAMVASAMPTIELVTGTAADEFDWSGSRDGWNELDHGNVHNPFNEFTDAAFPVVAQGRWMADEAVKTLENDFANAIAISDTTQLARAYLYQAIIYVTIADQFEDFAFSDRAIAAPPIGKANMATLYDQAASACDKGLAIPRLNATLKFQLTGMKARAQLSKAIWQQIHPASGSIVTGFVPASAQTAAAAATATAAITLSPTSDYKMQFTFGSTTGTDRVNDDFRSWINLRQEMRIGAAYAAPDPTGKPTWTTTVLKDPITNAIDPVTDAAQKAFKAASYPPFTVVSTREMRLIVAEDALARADTATFATQINTIRALDGLTGANAWNQLVPQVPALNILIHERRVNLFLQGRRLMDHYRFGTATYPVDWLSSSTARTAPGTVLPITAVECLSNSYIGAANCGK